MSFFNLSPVQKGEAFRSIDERIKSTVAQQIADGVPESALREEFEIALAQIEPHISPAEAGSFLRVLDEAVNEAQKGQANLSPPIRGLT